MKLKKRVFFDIHSWIGVRLSILFFIVCFSGALATVSHEMDWLMIPEIRAHSASGEWASRNTMVANLKKAYPNGSIEYWWRTDEPYLCDIIYMQENGKRSYVFANPYTGAIQGKVQITFQRFFRDLHYYLFIPFQIGHFTVLVFGFLLFISLCTALLFYKKWWHKLFELKTGNGPLVFFRSLHRLVGLWSVPFTLLFSLTGIWYFLERTDIGGISTISNPKDPSMAAEGEAAQAVLEIGAAQLDYDRAVAIAESQIPGLRVGSILPPQKSASPIYLTGMSDVPLVRERANRVYLHPSTYEVLKVQNARNISGVMWANDIMDPLHFGSWGGLITKIIWFLFGLGISSLVLTGIWVTLKRKAVKRAKKQTKVMGVWRYINWALYGVILFFMYYILYNVYSAPFQAFMVASLGWALFLWATWYFFVLRIDRAALASAKKMGS